MALSQSQERVSELCSKAATIDDPDEFERVMSELKGALREQLVHLKDMLNNAKQTISILPSDALPERRKTERRKGERRKPDPLHFALRG